MEDRLIPSAGDAARAPIPASADAREAAYVLAAGLVILLATVAWWALALWPAPTGAPAWLERTRLVCFGIHEDGLPDAAGWLALVGEPLGMLAILLVGWRAGVREVARRARERGWTRVALRSVALVLLALGLLGGWRIRSVLAAQRLEAWTPPPAGSVARLDRAAPPLALLDQRGRRRTLAELRGRPILLTFAYAHCETMCPVTVRAVTDAAARLRSRLPPPAIVVVTLDPWRDTPARLPALAREWALPEGALVLGGSVPEVEAALDAWQVARSRDARTGEITHAPMIYVLGTRGRIAFQAPADAGTLVALGGRL